MIEIEQKVYALTEHKEHEEYPASSRIVGIYAKKEDALKELDNQFNDEQEEWLSEYEEDDIEVGDYETEKTLFCLANNIEYTRYSVEEFIVKQ